MCRRQQIFRLAMKSGLAQNWKLYVPGLIVMLTLLLQNMSLLAMNPWMHELWE